MSKVLSDLLPHSLAPEDLVAAIEPHRQQILLILTAMDHLSFRDLGKLVTDISQAALSQHTTLLAKNQLILKTRKTRGEYRRGDPRTSLQITERGKEIIRQVYAVPETTLDLVRAAIQTHLHSD